MMAGIEDEKCITLTYQPSPQFTPTQVDMTQYIKDANAHSIPLLQLDNGEECGLSLDQSPHISYTRHDAEELTQYDLISQTDSLSTPRMEVERGNKNSKESSVGIIVAGLSNDFVCGNLSMEGQLLNKNLTQNGDYSELDECDLNRVSGQYAESSSALSDVDWISNDSEPLTSRSSNDLPDAAFTMLSLLSDEEYGTLLYDLSSHRFSNDNFDFVTPLLSNRVDLSYYKGMPAKSIHTSDHESGKIVHGLSQDSIETMGMTNLREHLSKNPTHVEYEDIDTKKICLTDTNLLDDIKKQQSSDTANVICEKVFGYMKVKERYRLLTDDEVDNSIQIDLDNRSVIPTNRIDDSADVLIASQVALVDKENVEKANEINYYPKQEDAGTNIIEFNCNNERGQNHEVYGYNLDIETSKGVEHVMTVKGDSKHSTEDNSNKYHVIPIISSYYDDQFGLLHNLPDISNSSSSEGPLTDVLSDNSHNFPHNSVASLDQVDLLSADFLKNRLANAPNLQNLPIHSIDVNYVAASNGPLLGRQEKYEKSSIFDWLENVQTIRTSKEDSIPKHVLDYEILNQDILAIQVGLLAKLKENECSNQRTFIPQNNPSLYLDSEKNFIQKIVTNSEKNGTFEMGVVEDTGMPRLLESHDEIKNMEKRLDEMAGNRRSEVIDKTVNCGIMTDRVDYTWNSSSKPKEQVRNMLGEISLDEDVMMETITKTDVKAETNSEDDVSSVESFKNVETLSDFDGRQGKIAFVTCDNIDLLTSSQLENIQHRQFDTSSELQMPMRYIADGKLNDYYNEQSLGKGELTQDRHSDDDELRDYHNERGSSENKITQDSESVYVNAMAKNHAETLVKDAHKIDKFIKLDQHKTLDDTDTKFVDSALLRRIDEILLKSNIPICSSSLISEDFVRGNETTLNAKHDLDKASWMTELRKSKAWSQSEVEQLTEGSFLRTIVPIPKQTRHAFTISTQLAMDQLPLGDTAVSYINPQERLRPYKPAGSRETYYTESETEDKVSVAESGTTVESSHIGSDDAVAPYFPPSVLGSRKPNITSTTTGLYAKLSTIEEKSFSEDRESTEMSASKDHSTISPGHLQDSIFDTHQHKQILRQSKDISEQVEDFIGENNAATQSTRSAFNAMCLDEKLLQRRIADSALESFYSIGSVSKDDMSRYDIRGNCVSGDVSKNYQKESVSHTVRSTEIKKKRIDGSPYDHLGVPVRHGLVQERNGNGELFHEINLKILEDAVSTAVKANDVNGLDESKSHVDMLKGITLHENCLFEKMDIGERTIERAENKSHKTASLPVDLSYRNLSAKSASRNIVADKQQRLYELRTGVDGAQNVIGMINKGSHLCYHDNSPRVQNILAVNERTKNEVKHVSCDKHGNIVDVQSESSYNTLPKTLSDTGIKTKRELPANLNEMWQNVRNGEMSNDQSAIELVRDPSCHLIRHYLGEREAARREREIEVIQMKQLRPKQRSFKESKLGMIDVIDGSYSKLTGNEAYLSECSSAEPIARKKNEVSLADSRSQMISDSSETLFSIPEDTITETEMAVELTESSESKLPQFLDDSNMAKLRVEIRQQKEKHEKRKHRERARLITIRKLEQLLMAKHGGKISGKILGACLNDFDTDSSLLSSSLLSTARSVAIDSSDSTIVESSTLTDKPLTGQLDVMSTSVSECHDDVKVQSVDKNRCVVNNEQRRSLVKSSTKHSKQLGKTAQVYNTASFISVKDNKTCHVGNKSPQVFSKYTSNPVKKTGYMKVFSPPRKFTQVTKSLRTYVPTDVDRQRIDRIYKLNKNKSIYQSQNNERLHDSILDSGKDIKAPPFKTQAVKYETSRHNVGGHKKKSLKIKKNNANIFEKIMHEGKPQCDRKPSKSLRDNAVTPDGEVPCANSASNLQLCEPASVKAPCTWFVPLEQPQPKPFVGELHNSGDHFTDKSIDSDNRFMDTKSHHGQFKISDNSLYSLASVCDPSHGVSQLTLQEAMRLYRPAFISHCMQRQHSISMYMKELQICECLDEQRCLVRSHCGSGGRRRVKTSAVRLMRPSQAWFGQGDKVAVRSSDVVDKERAQTRKAENYTNRVRARLFSRRVQRKLLEGKC